MSTMNRSSQTQTISLCCFLYSSELQSKVTDVIINVRSPDLDLSLPHTHTRRFLVLFSPEPETKCGGVHSRPLDSDDLRMIEEDLSKQLGSSPRDREWDTEPDLEPYITSLENGGMQSSKDPFINCLSEIHPDLSRSAPKGM